MFKKRFTKWGLKKNAKRPASSAPEAALTEHDAPCRAQNSSSILTTPKLSNHDGIMLMFLSSVQTWNTSFYDYVQCGNTAPASSPQSMIEQSEEMSFTFKLVIEMLERGHGSLAGRATRKAFLLLEDLLLLEGPALLWNLLEIMHYIVSARQMELFQLLSAHLLAMSNHRMPGNHPLAGMMRMLGESIVATGQAGTDARSSPSADNVLLMLNRAWTLNADLLFHHFDARLFQLYTRIHYDTCSIEPPKAIVDATKRWLSRVASQQLSSIASKDKGAESMIYIAPLETDKLLQRVLEIPVTASLPVHYELLRDSSIKALWCHVSSIVARDAGAAGDKSMLLRILAGLLTAHALEGMPTNSVPPELSTSGSSRRISRGQAGNIACAVRTSIDLDNKDNQDEVASDTVEQIRSILALREYANTETDPRLIQEMCVLERALVALGQQQEASEVGRLAACRLEEYVRSVPTEAI